MILEIIAGPETGRRIKLREGETVSFGRTDSAMNVFAEDPAMSAMHFSVSLSAGTFRMENFSQTNGTLVNDARIESAVLQPGDKVRAGSTVFAVIGPPPNPYPAQVRIGGWGFNIVPDGWTTLDGVGLIHQAGDEFRANATAVEEALPEGKTLREYAEVQMGAAGMRLSGVEFQGPSDARMEGSEEALLLTLTSETQDGKRITQRQIYARSADVVGILTLSGLANVNQDFIEIVRGASFHKPQIPA
jgi:hypothetical protein